VVVVAWIIVVVAAWLAVSLLRQPYTGNAGCCSMGGTIWLSSPVDTAAGAHQWFNFTIVRLNYTLSPDDMTIVARNPVGTIFYPLAWTILFAHPVSNEPLAVYNASTGNWNNGGSVSLARGDILSVDVGSNVVTGDTLALLGKVKLGGAVILSLN
jgi:hypothetical protein